MTCKIISKVLKIVCAIGIVFTSYLKWVGRLQNVDVNEICVVWAVVYGIGAGTIDLNIILDKILVKGESNGCNKCTNSQSVQRQ